MEKQQIDPKILDCIQKLIHLQELYREYFYITTGRADL